MESTHILTGATFGVVMGEDFVADPESSCCNVASLGFGGSTVLGGGKGLRREEGGRSGNDGFVFRFVMRLQSNTNVNLIGLQNQQNPLADPTGFRSLGTGFRSDPSRIPMVNGGS